jgi:hypothetical protein
MALSESVYEVTQSTSMIEVYRDSYTRNVDIIHDLR